MIDLRFVKRQGLLDLDYVYNVKVFHIKTYWSGCIDIPTVSEGENSDD